MSTMPTVAAPPAHHSLFSSAPLIHAEIFAPLCPVGLGASTAHRQPRTWGSARACVDAERRPNPVAPSLEGERKIQTLEARQPRLTTQRRGWQLTRLLDDRLGQPGQGRSRTSRSRSADFRDAPRAPTSLDTHLRHTSPHDAQRLARQHRTDQSPAREVRTTIGDLYDHRTPGAHVSHLDLAPDIQRAVCGGKLLRVELLTTSHAFAQNSLPYHDARVSWRKAGASAQRGAGEIAAKIAMPRLPNTKPRRPNRRVRSIYPSISSATPWRGTSTTPPLP